MPPYNAFWAASRTGGGTGALDALDGSLLADKDMSILAESTDTMRFWWLDADASGSEGEAVTNPDTNPGTKSWLLLGVTLPNSGLHILDTGTDHDLIFAVGEDLSQDTTLTLTLGDANRTLTLNENLTIGDGTNITITGVTQANTLTLYESLTLGDGNSGTLTFSAASKTVTVAGSCTLNDWFDQAVKVASTPTFGGLTIGSDGSGGDILAYGGTASNSLIWDASENVLDIASTMKAADNVVQVTVTDATTLSSGYGRGMYVGYTVSGSKSGSYAINGLGIDMTVSEACPTVSALEVYTAAISNKTVGNLYPISIYCEDIGTAVSNFMALDIGINSTNTAASRHTGIRIRNHSGTAKAAIMIEEAFTDTILRHSPSGIDLKLVTLDNSSGAIFYWDDSETKFRFNKGLYVDEAVTLGSTLSATGNIATSGDYLLDNGNYIGISGNERLEFFTAGYVKVRCKLAIGNITPTYDLQVKGHAYVYNNAVNTTASYAGIAGSWTKTAGTTDSSDHFYGIDSSMTINDSDSTIGLLYGMRNNAILTAGTVGSNIIGLYCVGRIAGGTVDGDVAGLQGVTDIDGGTVTGNIKGIYAQVDMESGVTSVGGNVYGIHIWVDADKDPTGSVYMLYLQEQNAANTDYCIYQSGTSPSHFGGDVDVNGHDAGTAGLKLGGTLITASATEINLLDGATTLGNFAISAALGTL